MEQTTFIEVDGDVLKCTTDEAKICKGQMQKCGQNRLKTISTVDEKESGPAIS